MALGFCIIMHIGKRGCSVCALYNALAKLKEGWSDDLLRSDMQNVTDMADISVKGNDRFF